MVDDGFFLNSGAGVFTPTDHVRGPWSAELMHAGPPVALIAHELRRAPLGVPEPGSLARLTVEILRPVPVTDVTIGCRALRTGRRVALLEAALHVDGADEPCMLARAWVLRDETVPGVDAPATDVPGPGTALAEIPAGWGRGYLDAIDWRWVEGSFERPGPATVWARPRYPLVAGDALEPLDSALIVADSGSGISAVANPADLLFVNTEITLHLYRTPAALDVWMHAETRIGPHGTGLASTNLGDQEGAFGIANQCLFIAAR